jgi:hypothetical protein
VFRTSAGGLASVALAGQAAQGLTPGTTFVNFDQAVVNNSGAVAFIGTLKQGSDKQAIVLSVNRRNQLIALEGQAAPGAGGSKFSNFLFQDLWMNDAGDVALIAELDDNRQGVFLYSAGRVTLVALSEQAAPGTDGQTFGTFGSVMINNQQQIVFDNEFSETGSGVFLFANNQITPVAISGLEAPGTDGQLFTLFSRCAINELGTVAFFARWGSVSRGIFSFTNNTLNAVALSGQLVPNRGETRFFEFYGLSLDDRGTIVFTASVDSSLLPSAIFLAAPASN